MKILQVITSLETGGAEKLMVDIIPLLKKRGLDVDILLFNGKDTPFKAQLQQQGINVFQLSKNGNVHNPLLIFKLIKYLKRYDIVHTHNTAPQLFAAIGSIFCSVVLVTTEHSTFNRRRKWKWYRPVDRWMYCRYHHIICISDKAKQNLCEYLPILSCSISTICNGVDVKKFFNAKTIQLPVPQGSVITTMVAGFRFEKDQKTVIRAFSLLPQNFHILFVGDGEFKHECEQLASDLKIAGRVHFLGIRYDIPNILHSSDVVVLSSHYEGLSLSSVEGMSCGKPFVASDVPGLHEVVNGAGLLFEHENAEQLAQIIKKLSEDKILYSQTIEKCTQRAMQYDIEKMVDGYEKVYLNLKIK